jgi:hypothetical protein
MDDWQWNSSNMLHRLRVRHSDHPGEIPVWIKIRIDPTMHEHAIIDQYVENLRHTGFDFEFDKHESGPEIIAYLAVAVVGSA